MSPGDPGLARERTVLAWRRTGLALLVGALTVGRLVLDDLGPLVLAPTALAVAAASWVVAHGVRTRRLAPLDGAGTDAATGQGALRDGRLPAVVAGTLAALALGELVSALGALA